MPKVQLLLPAGSKANVLPVALAFERFTGTKVVLREVAVDDVASTVTLESLAGRAGFDVALPATFALPDLVEAQALRALDDFAIKHEPKSVARGSLYSHGDRYKGRFYGYQADGDVYVMFYNRNMLEDASARAEYEDRYGTSLGTPRTWEELDRQLEFFHRPDQGQFGGALFRIPGYIEWEWWLRLHAKGALPVDDQMRPLFHGAEGVAALEELIRASAWLSPGAAANGLFENWREFGEGRTYCNIGWGGSQKYLSGPSSEIRHSLAFGPTPGGMDHGQLVPVSYFNWGWNYVVSAQSSLPELAYLFTLYASLPGPSTRSVQAAEGFFDPHRMEHYDDPKVVEVYSRAFLDQHRSCLAQCIPDFYLQGRDEYFSLLSRYIDRANRGQLKPARALELAARGWELITERLDRANQIEQWKRIKVSYPRHILDFASR